MLQNLFVLFKKNASGIFLLGTICFVILFNSYQSPWRYTKVIDWDVTSYYGYLPAFFIHNDLTLSFTEQSEENFMANHQFWPEIAPNGGKVIKTTMGMAFLYSPFFGIAHLEAKLFNLKQDGFSYSYHKWIHFAGIFYLVIGLIFLRKVLLCFFSEVVSGISIFIIICCTNALYYSTFQTAMPHIIDFSLLSIFLYLSIKWMSYPTLSKTVLLGMISGLMVLIRPTNILFFLFPLLLNITKFSDLKTRLFFFLHEWKKLLILALISFVIILPQLIYWKMITGSFIFNSYVGESFFWTNPHILEGLFSYRKGWLVYSPIMIFSVFGFILLYFKKKYLFWSVFPFFTLNIYVLFCWWSWWYGGGYGMRSMIDCYPLLSFPLAAIIGYILKMKKPFMIGFGVLVLLAFKLNLTQIEQYKHAVVHWDGMTKEAYWASFGGKEIDSTYWDLIEKPNYDKARKGEDEYYFEPF